MGNQNPGIHIPPIGACDPQVRQALQDIVRRLGITSSPVFDSITFSGLTASRIVATDADKGLKSLASPLIVAEGGTGAATFTDHGILLGSGTGAITPLGAAANGQLPIGSVGADPTLATLTGTANQITVTNGAGSITLALPQDYDTGATPTLAGLTLTTVAHEETDVDKFLVDSSGVIKYRTGAEMLSDAGASASSHLHDGDTLQHDGVNSDGGAFSFTTTGAVTFNQSVGIGTAPAASQVLHLYTIGKQYGTNVLFEVGDANQAAFVFKTPTGNSYLGATAKNGAIFLDSVDGDMLIANRAGGAIRISADTSYYAAPGINILESGYTGFGILTPLDQVHVVGNVRVSANLTDGTNSLTVANLKTAFDHATADGSSHSFVDQDVTASGTPTLAGLTLTNTTGTILDAGGWTGVPDPIGAHSNIYGDLFCGNTGANTGRLRLSSNLYRGFVAFNRYWTGAANAQMDTSRPSWVLNLHANSDYFAVQRSPAASTTLASLLFVKGSSGYVGITNTSPLANLDVIGTTRLGDSTTNYTAISATGDITFVGSAGFYPRRITQSAEPANGTGTTQVDVGELLVWHDPDDSKTYLVYQDTNEGVHKVEMS